MNLTDKRKENKKTIETHFAFSKTNTGFHDYQIKRLYEAINNYSIWAASQLLVMVKNKP